LSLFYSIFYYAYTQIAGRMSQPELIYWKTLLLPHQGDCGLIAITPDEELLVEEVYGDAAGDGNGTEVWMAQHRCTFDGEVLESIDEDWGEHQELTPLAIPSGSYVPHPVWHSSKALNFRGPRHRGMREEERVQDMVVSLNIAEKMALIRHYNLSIMPPQLLGVAESYVIAEAMLQRPDLYIVCRRIRLAIALPEVQVDDDQQPYNYDTQVFYLAHWFDRSLAREPSLADLLNTLPGAEFHRPMDCILTPSLLCIADGGGTLRQNCVHLWQVEHPTEAETDL
jgi:hypothetical protein